MESVLQPVQPGLIRGVLPCKEEGRRKQVLSNCTTAPHRTALRSRAPEVAVRTVQLSYIFYPRERDPSFGACPLEPLAHDGGGLRRQASVAQGARIARRKELRRTRGSDGCLRRWWSCRRRHTDLEAADTIQATGPSARAATRRLSRSGGCSFGSWRDCCRLVQASTTPRQQSRNRSAAQQAHDPSVWDAQPSRRGRQPAAVAYDDSAAQHASSKNSCEQLGVGLSARTPR